MPDWLAALPSEQALTDATRVVSASQRDAGIDLPTDGEVYRFDVNHPDTNGMIEYFVHRLGGVRREIGREDTARFRAKTEMQFRRQPAAVVTDAITEGTLNLPGDCARAVRVAAGPFKFTLTSPYMLARTLLDDRYRSLEGLTLALAEVPHLFNRVSIGHRDGESTGLAHCCLLARRKQGGQSVVFTGEDLCNLAPGRFWAQRTASHL